MWYFFIVLLINIAITIIVARIADEKGYSVVGFVFFSLWLGIVALFVVLLIDDKNEE